MKKPWMKNLRDLDPYIPGEQPKDRSVTKLNTNENPYPPAPGVLRRLAAMTQEDLRRYPDPDSTILVRALAEYHGVGADQVFAGVGSDDVLATAFQTFFNGPEPILFPDITYAFYAVWARLFSIPYECPELTADFRLRKEDYLRPNGGIVFPNPNAPTSVEEPAELIEEIVRANPGSVVIIDEAYADFGEQTVLPLCAEYDNLLVVRTFSKSRSMAGMRIGYAVGSPELIAAMNAVKYSYNSYTMSAAALAAGEEALKDEAYFRDTLRKITDTRTQALGRLGEMGFTAPGASANFLFVTHPSLRAGELFRRMREEQIYVRYFDRPVLRDYLRITVGTPEQMEILYRFLERQGI